jgi:hypothetical protein
MNEDQATGVLRVIVPAICTWLASQGFAMFGDSAIVVQITAAVVAIGAVVWSFLKHTDSAKLQAAAAIDPNIDIKVPVNVLAKDDNVAKLVADSTVPNVTAVKPADVRK